MRSLSPIHALLATLALALAPAGVAAAQDCSRFCDDSCCECSWVTRKTHDDPWVFVEPRSPYGVPYDGDDDELRYWPRNGADVAGACYPDHFYAQGRASGNDGNLHKDSASTQRLLRRIVIQHVNECDACAAGGARMEIDLAVGFGIQGEIDRPEDCLAWCDGYQSISSPPDVAAVAEGRLDLGNEGWYALSRSGSLIGGTGGFAAGGGFTRTGYYDIGEEDSASVAFYDTDRAIVEQSRRSIRWRAQVASVGVQATSELPWFPPLRRFLYGPEWREAEIEMATTLSSVRVKLSCDDCGHLSSRQALTWIWEPDDEEDDG